MRRVVITGLGIISSLGQTLDDVSASLKAQRSGIGLDPERKARGFRSGLTGQIHGFDVAARFDRKARKTMSQVAQYGCAAAFDAVAHAGLSREQVSRPEVGLIFGNETTSDAAEEFFRELEKTKRTQSMGTGHIIKVMNSTVSMNLSALLGIQGACWTLSAACASGLHSVGQGAMLISQGLQEVMICGGAQEIGWQGMGAFDAIGALSVREDSPTTASRPFDTQRDGLVPSGGGAALVLESLKSAQARGARIYGELLGYGFSCDGGHLTNPSGDGARRAMLQALSRASVAPAELDYVNAHATSTPAGDAVEASAISQVLAGAKVPVSSTKGLTGHECWMSGASELIYSLLMGRDGFIAGNTNLDTADDACAGLELPRTALPRAPRTVLKNSFGFGGTNASVVVRTRP